MNDKQNPVKRVDVSIGGNTYHISSAKSEEKIREIAERADRAFYTLINKNPGLSTLQASVLLIINLMDSLTDKAAQYEAELARIKDKADKTENCERELFLVREDAFELKKELHRLRELNKQLMLEISGLKADKDEDSPLSNQTTIEEYLSSSE